MHFNKQKQDKPPHQLDMNAVQHRIKTIGSIDQWFFTFLISGTHLFFTDGDAIAHFVF